MILFERLRKMPVADVSLTLSIGFFAYAILLLIVGIVLVRWMDSQTTILSLCGVWLGTVILCIWKSGRADERSSRVLDLGVMHVLPLLMLLMCIPHFSSWDDISYMLGFVEVLLSGSLVSKG